MKKIFAGILIFVTMLLCVSFAAYADTDNLSESIKLTLTENGFEISCSKSNEDVFSDFDRINIIILKPDCDFNSITSGEDAEKNIYFVKNFFGKECTGNVLFSYDFPSYVANQNDIDIYPIKVAVTSVSGEYYETNLRYKKINPEYIKNAIRAFSHLKAEEFADTWVNLGAPMFDVPDQDEFDKHIKLISKQFVLVRKAFFSEQNITEFNNQTSIINCIERAILLYTLENSDKNAAKNMIEKYGFIFDETFDFSKDFTAFYNLYSAVKDDYINSDDLDYLKKVCIMANMQNGMSKRTIEEIANCLRMYSNEMQINLTYATAKSVSINKIAARIDTDDISKYYKNSEWFNDIVDEIYNEENKDGAVSPSYKGGSGGKVNIGNTEIVRPPEQFENDTYKNQKSAFNDLNGYEWAKEAIENLYEKKIVSGDGNGNYFPSRNVTREEFVKMICMAFELYSETDNSQDAEFTDVNTNDWFYPYVCVAKTNGIVNGKSDMVFGTGENISRQDMACMLYNLLIYKKVNIVSEHNNFSDNESISLYAEKAVDILTSIGIISGFDDNTFRPFENADRGQAAKLIYNMGLYLN